MSTFHIAILECDTIPESVAEKHGTYGGMIENALRQGHEDAGSPVKGVDMSHWDVIEAQEYPSLQDVDAVFLTAGGHDADVDDPWVPRLLEFVREVYAAGKPLMGVCYGHQIIARALGGTVSRSAGGWEVSVEEVKLSTIGKDLFETSSLKLHQMHRDAVIEIPEGLEVIGSSERCDTQLLYQRGRILTTQGHPEFDQVMCREMLEERRLGGILDEQLFSKAVAKSGWEHDGALFWRITWKFLLESAEK